MTDDLNALVAALPGGRVITDPDIVEGYRRDQTSAVAPGKPLCVVSARGTGEVAATMRWASEHGVPVVPRGGGTGLAGGAAAVDGGVILSLARMNAIWNSTRPTRWPWSRRACSTPTWTGPRRPTG